MSKSPFVFRSPLHVNGNQLQAQGEVSLLQTDYGIKPVKAGRRRCNSKR